MAYASVHHQSNRAGILAPLRNALVSMRTAWQRSRVYANTYNELSVLSTRELDDLGIPRSAISRIAYEAAYGRDD